MITFKKPTPAATEAPKSKQAGEKENTGFPSFIKSAPQGWIFPKFVRETAAGNLIRLIPQQADSPDANAVNILKFKYTRPDGVSGTIYGGPDKIGWFPILENWLFRNYKDRMGKGKGIEVRPQGSVVSFALLCNDPTKPQPIVLNLPGRNYPKQDPAFIGAGYILLTDHACDYDPTEGCMLRLNIGMAPGKTPEDKKLPKYSFALADRKPTALMPLLEKAGVTSIPTIASMIEHPSLDVVYTAIEQALGATNQDVYEALKKSGIIESALSQPF